MSKRILVVDDNKEILLLIGRCLEDCGYEVVTAGNGVEALEEMSKQPFDLVLTDRDMPVLDGIGLTREVQRIYPHIPVLMMSGRATEPEIEAEAKSAGALLIFSKPLRLASLLANIKFVVG